ncbi:hypothetical protein [Streptomyces sp. NPDC056632]|uniref:hypothetical protein n=1 Tax=Streptomyces sp. NPDC056632 TaxID=3345884 RepID=UPI0036754EAA
MMHDSRSRRLRPVVALCALALTACSSESAGPPEDRLCKVPAGSPEEKSLHTVLRADTFRTDWHQPRDARFVEKVEENLRNLADPAAMYTVTGCSYVPKGQVGIGRATIDFEWVPLDAAKKDPAYKRKDPADKEPRTYRLNGATGVSNDVFTSLYVSCLLPGELKEPSKRVLLRTNAAFTVNLGPVHDHGTQDQQMDFVYRMTRKATEVLGCENKPLEKDPAVKPVASQGSAS